MCLPARPLRPLSGYIHLGYIQLMKPARFLGTTLQDLRSWPAMARQEGGHQLDQVQRGLDPDDWKPMPTVGPGVREIRIREADGAFRLIYVASFAEAVYVLHAFQKKTQQTAKRDLELATRRFRDLIGSR